MHFARLDVLRGLAIILVVAFHYQLTQTTARGDAAAREWLATFAAAVPEWLRFAVDFIALPLTHGRFGVTLFFIISGYCIHVAYLKWRLRHATAPTKAFVAPFIWRRFWRIYPPMLVALLLGWIVAYSSQLWAPPVLRHLGASLLMVRNFSPGSMLVMNGPLWSVTIEWQLYLLFPFLLLLAGGRRWLLPIAFGGGVVSCFWVFGLPAWQPAEWLSQLPVRWWAEWLLGVALAELHFRGKTLFPRPTVWLAALALAAPLALILLPSTFFAWLLPRLAFAALVECAVRDPRPLRGLERPLATIGLCSYSIYLFHVPVLELLEKSLHGTSWSLLSNPVAWLALLPAYLIVIYALSAVSRVWLEQGSVALGQRLWERRTTRRPPQTLPATTNSLSARKPA